MSRSLRKLRARRKALRLEAEIAALEEQAARRPASCLGWEPLAEVFGDVVDRREYLYDELNLSAVDVDDRVTTPADRKHGRNLPFFENERDLRQILGIARFLTGWDEHAIGALENLTNYVIGTGFMYSVTPQAGADPLAARCACQVVETFLDENHWKGDLERELFQRSRRDGEFFLWLRPAGGGHVRAQVVEPEFVTEPAQPRVLEDWLGAPAYDWSFGVATDLGDPQMVHGYFVEWFGDAGHWDYVPGEQMVHCKLNVDRGVKRGVSDFLAVYQYLDRADRLLGNTLQGSAVRAAVAYITEHAPGTTATQIENLTSTLSDTSYLRRTPNAVKTVRVNQREAGTRLDVESGRKFHTAMQGSPEGPSHIQVLQAALRRVGARWSMPEYMVSGDASNGNYASSLVAESPFLKAAETKQAFYKCVFSDVLWKVLALACRTGGLSVSPRDLRRMVDIRVEAQPIGVRNQLEEMQIRKAQHKAGVLSTRTWAEQSGLDFDQELARMKEE